MLPPDYESEFLMTDTSHKAASHNLREIASWLPGKGSADSDLLPELDTIVARSRDLSRNHGIAAGAMQTLSDNIVGTGFRLSAKPDYRLLGKTKEWEEEWQAHVESLWRSWSETFECDAAKSLTFQGLTTQVFKSCLINGEALAIPLTILVRLKTRLHSIMERLLSLLPWRLIWNCHRSTTRRHLRFRSRLITFQLK